MAEICVYCGSSAGIDPQFMLGARELGRVIAAHGHGMVYGGGRVGLMGAVADAALAAGGQVTGVIPTSLEDREIAHQDLTELIVTDSMHRRKAIMAERADGFIALPGGFGTLDEVMEILTWNQIGVIRKPVVFLDIAGYYTKLFEFLDHTVEVGLLKGDNRQLIRQVTDPERAVAAATSPAPTASPKWDRRAEK